MAVTGQVGYQIPTTSFDVGQGTFIPQVLVYGGSLQYSMPYLKSQVKDLGLPDLINHLIPLVEVQFATPVANNLGNSFVTTGIIVRKAHGHVGVIETHAVCDGLFKL